MPERIRIRRIASIRDAAALRAHLAELGATLPCDDVVETGAGAPLAEPLDLGGVQVPNRFVIQPMEGWDATSDGRPSELTLRRWRRFGSSGAGWVWGGEAVAVMPEGRANPNQLVIDEKNAPALGALRRELLAAAREAGRPEPYVGLQLTHSGRWAAPEAGMRHPRVPCRHPILDGRVGISDDSAVIPDAELPALVQAFAEAARLAAAEGFSFVDVKHCHGYLLHEFLSARTRSGGYGGPGLEVRMRLTREILGAVRAAAPELRIGVRLSIFDGLPRSPSGEPEPHSQPYLHGFGLNADAPGQIDLAEPVAFARELVELGVGWINATAASPYYAPHLQRPAAFPPSDGYPPPEDPLLGVARLLGATRQLKAAVPDAVVVASGVTYLQEYLPHVSQACVREGWFDAVGLGRMALVYPELPAHVLEGRALERKLLCRTFSDCTTAPRKGMVSGCYPLDDFYKQRPERERLEALKRGAT